MADGIIAPFDYLFDLENRVWASLGSLDSAALVAATDNGTFSAFSLWSVTPSSAGVSNFVEVDPATGDYELRLDPDDMAVHDIGVLSRTDQFTYDFTFDTSVANAPLTVALLINGTTVQLASVTYDPATPNAAMASFDISGVNLSAFRPGVSPVSLKITNADLTAVLLDNFAVTGATLDTLEAIGEDEIPLADAPGAPTVSVTTADFATHPEEVQAALGGLTFVVGDVDAVSGAYFWTFQAPPFLFDFVPQGDILQLDILITFPTASGPPIERTVTIGVTGRNDPPDADNQNFTGVAKTPFHGQLDGADVDGDTLTFALVTDATDGTATVNPDGSFVFTPGGGFSNFDRITFRVTDANGASVERTAAFYEHFFDLSDRSWPSLATLDNAALVAAADDPAFDGFSLWRVAPSAGSLAANAATPGDFELELLATGSAVHAIGVLNPDVTESYEIGLEASAPNADLTLELLVDGVVVQARAATYEAGAETAASAVFDLSLLDLSTYTVGVTPVSLRVTNNDAANAVRLDNFAVAGATFAQIEEIGSETFDASGLTGTVRVSEIAVSQQGAGTAAISTEALAAFAVHLLDASAGRFSWNFSAPTGLFDFVPLGQSVVLEYTVRLEDEDGVFVEEVVPLTIVGSNQAPESTSAPRDTAEDVAITGTLVASDVDGDALTFALVDASRDATVTVAANGTYTYTPKTNANGVDTFTYSVTDSHGARIERDFTVNVSAVNDAPLNLFDRDIAQAAELNVNGSVRIPLAALKLSDPDAPATLTVIFDSAGAGTFTFVGLTDPSIMVNEVAGVATLTGAPAALNAYFARVGAAASYQDTSATETVINVSVSDNGATGTPGPLVTPLGTVIITLDSAPVAGDDTLSVTEDLQIAGDLPGMDPDGDPLTFALVTGQGPAHGTLKIKADGKFTYIPDPGYIGDDFFDFKVSGGGAFDIGRITLNITAADPGAPRVYAENARVKEDGTLADTLQAFVPGGATLGFALDAVGGPTKGTVTLAADGAYQYIPFADANGTDSFRYVVTGPSGTTTATAIITIIPQQDAPVAFAGTAVADEDVFFTGQLTGTDVDGETLTFALAAGGEPASGSVTILADGTYSYTPNPNFFGEDRFTFTVTDGIDTATEQVTITVNPVNDAPVVANDSFEMDEDGTVTRAIIASDIDGDVLGFALGTAPTRGAVTINDDNTYSYTPFENQNGSDSFTLTASDGTDVTTADISVEILPVNDAPEATDDSVVTREDQSAVLSLIDNDTDVDGTDLLSVLSVGPADNGVTLLQGDGTVLYTPDADFFGIDTFTYRLSDGNGGTAAGSVRVFVQSQGEIPVLGTDNDDVFEVRDSLGRDRAFDGMDGYDTVQNTRRGRDFNLTEASFDSIEELDGNGGAIVVDEDGRLDLSLVSRVTDVPQLQGRGGNETIFGSQDDDRIEGKDGQDALYGEGGDDTVVGGDGADLMEGGEGDDSFEIAGRDGEGDTFVGGAGTDTIRNTDRNHYLYLTGAQFDGIEVLDGNGGDIRVGQDGTLDLSAVGTLVGVPQIRGSSGNETITGTALADRIDGYRGDDMLSGGDGNDTVVGGDGADVLDGGTGDDLFEVDGSEGQGDSFVGGDGNDVVRNTHRGRDLYLTGATFDGIEEIDANGAAIRVARDGTLDLREVTALTDVEQILGAQGDETITGSQGDDLIDGEQGHDTVILPGVVADFEIEILNSGHGPDHYHGKGHSHDDTRVIVSGPDTGTDDLQDIEVVVFDDYTLFLDGRNNLPITRPDVFVTDEDSGFGLTDADLLLNDYDPDGDTFAVTSITSDAVEVTRTATGDITLDPAGGYEHLAQGATTTVTAQYTIEDAHGAVGTGTILLEITGVNDAPDADDDQAETSEQIVVSANVLVNDTDADDNAVLRVVQVNGQPITSAITLASGATVTMTPEGDFIYDPGDNFASVALGDTATDSFSYTLTDEFNATSTATVTLAIHGDNDAVTALPDSNEGTARRVLFQDAASGVLANDSDIDIGDTLQVSGIAGGSDRPGYVFRDGAFEQVTRFAAAGDTGGEFAIQADGAYVFDAGTDFDDLFQGQSRTTSVTYFASDGNGAQDSSTLTVTVHASELAPPDPSTAPPSGPPDGSRILTVEGDFDQLGGVDVLEELARRLSGDESIDLDTLFDLNLVDIDTTLEVAFDPTTGVAFTATDNNPGSDAILTNFGDELQTGADYVLGKVNPFITSPTSPVFFGPTFDLLATIQAQLGWDISASTLGKTAVFQPAAFDLFIPQDAVEENGQFQIYTGDITNGTPTSAVQTVGLGDIRVDAGFALAELQVSDVGFTIGTQDFLGLDLDGIFTGFLGLAGEIDLLEAAGDLSPVPLAGTISFSARDVIDGIATIGVSEFTTAIASGDAKEIAQVVQRAVTAIGEVASTTYPIYSAELRASELLTLVDRAKFNEYDGYFDDGTGFFEVTDTDDELIEITRSEVESVIDFNGIDDIIEDLSQLLGEDGFTVMDGLVIKATLPIGNIEEIEGFGTTDGAGLPVVAGAQGEQTIAVEQVTRLVGVELDFEALGPALAERAIDQAIEKALVAPNASTPMVIGAGLGAKVALLLGPELRDFVEDGFNSNSHIKPLALVAATFNPLIKLLNGISDLVNEILSAVGLPTIPLIPELTENNLESAFDTVMDSLGNAIVGALTGFASVAEDVLDFLANNPLTEAIDAALNVVKGIVTGGVGGALNALGDAIDTVGSSLGLGGALNFLNKIIEVANSGVTAVAEFDNILNSLFSELAGSVADFADFLETGVDTFVDTIKNIAKGVELNIAAEFNLFDFTVDAGVDLVQIATFNPYDVTTTYNVGGFEVETGLGRAATFTAAGGAGETLEGQVTYAFGGEVDYDYILRLEVTPDLTMYGFSVDGALTLGDPEDPRQSTNNTVSFDYAGVKITDDFGFDELGSLPITELFDDALIELPFGLAEDVAAFLSDQLRAGLGSLAGDSAGLDFNEIRLFTVDGVDVPAEQFTTITDTFNVQIGGIAPTSIGNLNFSEDATAELSDINLLDIDGVDGTLSQVAGSALNIDSFISLETGGQVFVNRAGHVVFDAGGDYEALALGDVASTDVEFSVDAPDGLQKVYIATIVVNGENDAPVALPGEQVMTEGGTLTFDPLANVTDVDNGAILRLVAASSEHGAAAVVDGLLQFTPEVDFFGDATIDYVVHDEHDAPATGRVTVSVSGTPDPVTAVADVLDAAENGISVIDVTANDYEPDGDVVRIVGFDQPTQGTLSLTTDGALAFDPEGLFETLAVGEVATQVVTVTVADTDGQSTETLTINVQGANDAPVAVDDQAATWEDRPVIFELAGNDSDVDNGDALRITSVGTAEHGLVELLTDGTVRYTPDRDYFGDDAFAYTVSDDQGGADTGTVSMLIWAQGEIPVLGNGDNNVFDIHYDSGRDHAFDGMAGYDVVRNTRVRRDTNLTDASFESIEEIDGNGGDITVDSGGWLDLSMVATLTNVARILGRDGNETITGSQDDDRILGRKGEDSLFGVGGNDTMTGGEDADLIDGGDGDDLFEIEDDDGAGDTFVGGAGTDTIVNTDARHDFDLANAQFHGVEVIDGNGGEIRVGRDGVLDLSSVGTLTDVERIRGASGDETIIGTDGDDLILGDRGADVLGGGAGNDTIDGGYHADRMEGGDGDDVFTIGGKHGVGDTFVGGDGQDVIRNTKQDQSFHLTGAVFDGIEEINGNGGEIRVGRDGVLDLSTVAVLTDVAGIRGNSGNETLTGSQGDEVIDGENGFDTVIVPGSVVDFDIEVLDTRHDHDHGNGHRHDDTHVIVSGPDTGTDTLLDIEQIVFDDYTLYLDGRNNAPIIRADAFGTDEDTALLLTYADLLANDYDPDGDPFGITSVSSADVAVLFDAAGGITLDPRGLYDTLAQGAYQDVTATYTTADAHGAVGSGKISLVITGVNDAPVANSDSGETTEQIIATGNVLGNDTDVDDGATLRITAVNGQPITTPITLASGAIVVMTSKGDFAYDPGDNFASVSLGRTTTDSFVYTLRDEHDAESEATVSIVIHGDNDPVSDSDESYAVEAAGALTVSAAEGLLAPGNAFDIDAHDVLRIVDADGVTPFLGDNGGTFYINADGSFSIDTGTDFNGLDRGATLTTSVTYRVTDGNGSFDTSTLSLVVTGSRFDPFTEDEPRFDEEFGPDDWAALQPILVEGTFEQLGGVDVATELFSDLVGAEVDLATIFDFTFLNVDKTISFVSLPGNAFDVTVTDNGSETPLPGFDSAIESLEGVAGRFLPLDLGPVTVKPTFDLDIELDINFGIDVDLPTLGKTAFFQPIQLTLLAPTEVAANQAFILTSGDLTSLSPETVMETIGLGSFAINSAFSIADSTISQLGYEVASSNVDAIGLELDGLAGQSLTFNAELRLGDIVEQTKEFVRAIVEDVTGVFGQVLPFDPEEVFDTLMSLDVTKVVSNIITGVVDFEALIERVQSSDAATALTAVGDLVSALLQEPEDPAPLAKIDVDGVEGAATAVELYDLFRRGLFNEFDRFDENNVGLFTLPVVDDAGAPTGATVEVTAQQVIDTMDLLGIPDRIESAVDALGGATFSPFDGIEVTFAMPVGNLDIIDGFGEDSAGVPITAPQTGTHSITVTQETALVSTSIDFEAVALSLVDALLDATADSSPQARALQTYLGVATQLAAAAEQGIIAELELDPAKLVQTAVNGAVDALNAAGDAIDSIIPGGDTFADIPSIGEADTLEAIDAFIDTTVGAFTRAFDMVSDLIEGVADFLGQFLSGGAMTLNAIADILGVATGLVGDAIQGAINTLNSVADFGITIPLLVTEIEIYPFRDIVQVPIDLLNGLKSGVDAANRGVDAIGDFADEIQTAANALTDFEMGDEVQRGLEDFADFLKDLTRGAYLGAELQADILEATMDASLSVVQEATFDPNEVTVDYAIGGFEIGTDLDKAVGLYALGGAGDQITGTATYNFSGNVDYEYSLKLDLDPHFQFLETTILGQLLVGDSINESFSEDLTLIEVRDKETSADLPDDGEERLVDLQFNFTAAVTQAVEDAFAASLGTLVPTDLDLGDGDVFLFRVEDVDLGEDRFLPITQDFTVDLL